MNDKPQQRTLKIGRATVGLVGLDIAFNQVLADNNIGEDEAVTRLFAEVARQNYIPESAADTYRQALKNEYRRLKEGTNETTAGLSIRILGPGCVSCNKLNTMVFDILQRLDLAADIEQIHELDEIWRHGVITTPALIINNKTVCAGRMPTSSEVEQWVRDAL